MTQPFEVIYGRGDSQEYIRLVENHLEMVELYNKEDTEWGLAGKWDHLIDLDPKARRDINNTTGQGAYRLERAFTLAKEGRGLWLTGHIELFGKNELLHYTPMRLWWEDETHGNLQQFEEEAKKAFNYRRHEKPELKIVRPA